MTRETLEKLPPNVREHIELFRYIIKDAGTDKISEIAKARLAGYVIGLRDAGLITERERIILFCYGTV